MAEKKFAVNNPMASINALSGFDRFFMSSLTCSHLIFRYSDVIELKINHARAGRIWAELTVHPFFKRNKVALRVEVLCDTTGSNVCSVGGVSISNPGYWGMNIEQGKTYKVVLHVKSLELVNISVSLAGANGQNLASAYLM
ncbi:hypothetical protein IFM89_033122 [Coptis chinensis]|uniref:Uncharacterized protein n=1 Tax=Coptis chinensis TaxID=261450 RepID=A0A835HIG3_9MAGN|nr:hypothetical protein IFM89_033122 [Coptis chinensis]